MKQNFEISDNIIDKEWDAFIATHPHGNIFQTSNMFRVFRKAKGYEPYRFWAVEIKTQKILGVVQGVLVREKGGLIGKFLARAIIQGGPLILDNARPDVIKRLMKTFDDQLCSKVIWSEIKNLGDTKEVLTPIKDYRFEDHLNYLIDLRQSEEEMWQKVRPTRRKNIRCGQRFNRLFEVKTECQVDILYDLLFKTYSRVKIPLADKSLFRAVWIELIPQGLAKIFLAKHGPNYTGGRLILIYKKTLYDWYAGAQDEYIKMCPNDFLVWNILLWGHQNGFDIFDFGGAGKPNVPYGPRDFKRQFGGELVNFGWPTKIYSPWKYHFAHLGLKVYQWVMSQMQGGKK